MQSTDINVAMESARKCASFGFDWCVWKYEGSDHYHWNSEHCIRHNRPNYPFVVIARFPKTTPWVESK